MSCIESFSNSYESNKFDYFKRTKRSLVAEVYFSRKRDISLLSGNVRELRFNTDPRIDNKRVKELHCNLE